MAVIDDIDGALDCIGTLKNALESAKDEIDSLEDRVSELEGDLEDSIGKEADVEDFAEALLQKYQGGTPSAGDVVKLKEKIEKLLVDEFHVSFGDL